MATKTQDILIYLLLNDTGKTKLLSLVTKAWSSSPMTKSLYLKILSPSPIFSTTVKTLLNFTLNSIYHIKIPQLSSLDATFSDQENYNAFLHMRSNASPGLVEFTPSFKKKIFIPLTLSLSSSTNSLN